MSYPPPPAEPTRPRRTLIVAVIAMIIAIVLVAALFAVLSGDRGTETSAPAPTGEKVDADLEEFYSQTLSWTDCGEARCTKVRVPVDYEDPGGGTLDLSMRIYPGRSGSAKYLLVNPGGPGGSAIDFAGRMKTSFGSSVTDEYNVVGVDPRGVGASSPLDCLDDKQMDDFVATDPDPDNESEIADLRRGMREMSQACANNSGELASHVSTQEAARDMDVVRALLGQKKLDWYGASYGSQLGATYANLFPKKVGRMVLDAAVDPSLDSFEGALGQAVGFQRAFDAYAADCVKESACPLGSSVAEARETVEKLFDDLDARPMKVGSGREFTTGHALYGVALPLYSKDSWSLLTDAFSAILDDKDASQLMALSDFYFDRRGGEYQTNQGQVIAAVNCLDATSRPTRKQVQARLGDFEKASPVFGRALGWGVLACSDWTLKSQTPQGDIDAKGAPPILVLGTTRDPATPYEWSRALADQLGTGVLVTREGDGHGAYSSGNRCIDSLVDKFFVDGTVPDDGTKCSAPAD